MKETLPAAKLVTILRNPIDRAYSFYNHNLRAGLENLTFEEAVLGTERELTFETEADCETCEGDGAEHDCADSDLGSRGQCHCSFLSVSAADADHGLFRASRAIELEPLDSSVSETMRIV